MSHQQLTITTLFSGAGGCDLGAIAAGFQPLEAVEYDPRIAELHKANISGVCHVKDILDCDPFKFERPDLLHASPVCKSFSSANKNKGELQLDVDCALKVCEFLRVLQPRWFTLENVMAYRRSHSFAAIENTLYELGYWVEWSILNAADFGVPQSRERLILRAAKGAFLPPLPPTVKRQGWYGAIADLVHNLPDGRLADWQIAALKDGVAGTVLIERDGARSDRPPQTRQPEEPCWTLRAMGQDGHYHRADALLGTKVVSLDIPCLARLQSFPDSYKWSGRRAVDGVGIGNSVPPLMYRAIASSLIA